MKSENLKRLRKGKFIKGMLVFMKKKLGGTKEQLVRHQGILIPTMGMNLVILLLRDKGTCLK